jgi:hypothetical protein
MSPRIQEATIREQRQMRQRQLMDAALSLGPFFDLRIFRFVC